MNRKIKACHAITYIVLFYLAAAVFLLGPAGVLEKDRMVAGNEAAAGTAQVRLDQQIQQVFLADGTYLRYLEVYVTSEESAGKEYHLLVYDGNNQILVNREIAMPETAVPGFLRIPVGIKTIPGQPYVWQLQGTDTPMDLAFENTGDTGLTSFGNYYISFNGVSNVQQAQNIVMRLIYTDSPSVKKMAVFYAGLFVLAAIFIGTAEYQGRKKQKLIKEVRVQTAVRLTAGPALCVTVLYLIYEVFWRNAFGGKADDKAVYGLGIALFAACFAWVIFAKRQDRPVKPMKALLKERGMDWLQTVFFAGALWGCIRFMNAQYQFYQDMAYRQVLLWSALILLTMGTAKALFCKRNIIWTAVTGILGLCWYQYQKCSLLGTGGQAWFWVKPAGDQAGQKLLMLKAEILIVVAAGLVLFSLIDKIRRRQFAWGLVNRFYAGLLAVFLLLLVLFRNTRGWPVYMAVVFGLFYLFYIGWDNRDRLLFNFSSGVMLNFALAILFCLARRPFRAWIYSRYNFVFHTVTITATYLTLVVCVLTVRLLMRLKDGKRFTDLWGTFVLYGMGVSFLFLTLSRTGYLAVIVMTVVMVPFVTFWCCRQKASAFFKNMACMILAAVLCLPAAYTGIRILPAIYNDPYIYEVEESAAAIHRDDPKDSTGYMSVSYFKYVMDNKLFADASLLKEEAEELMLCMSRELYVKPQITLVAGDGEFGPEEAEDFSNGRFEIFKCYMDHWNLTGHDEMGVPLPDGSISVHAHNTYLQVIHDHGLLVGGLYLVFGAVSAYMMFVYAVKKSKEDKNAALPLAVFIGFAVASLVEWLFHPCNPLGFSTMAVFAPLLCFNPKRGANRRQRLSNEGKKEKSI